MIYFTSDLHLGHENVLRLANRPWDNIENMNKALIDNINATVGYDDTLYILGDFSFKITVDVAHALLEKIQCQDIRLIKGNHDKNWGEIKGGSLFKAVSWYEEIKVESGHKFCLMHYPMLSWNGSRYSYGIHVHGHLHNQGSDYNFDNFKRGIYRYDAGVDANGYKPVSIEDIIALAEMHPKVRRDEDRWREE